MSEIDTSAGAIAALMDGVTPGPWELRGKQTIGSGINTVASCGWKNGRKDAPFIVACHKLVPALAAEHDELLQALRTADSYLDKGLDQIARNVTRAAILKHEGSNG